MQEYIEDELHNYCASFFYSVSGEVGKEMTCVHVQTWRTFVVKDTHIKIISKR